MDDNKILENKYLFSAFEISLKIDRRKPLLVPLFAVTLYHGLTIIFGFAGNAEEELKKTHSDLMNKLSLMCFSQNVDKRAASDKPLPTLPKA